VVKYYVVAEAELKDALNSAYAAGQAVSQMEHAGDELEKMDKAEAACRARVVPEWAEYFYRSDLDEDKNIVRRFEEIPK
jgi:hypothetical protein